MLIGPALITEPFDVHHENGSVYGRSRMPHLTSRCGTKPGTILSLVSMPILGPRDKTLAQWIIANHRMPFHTEFALIGMTARSVTRADMTA